jgi:hypothetical protein
MYMPWGKHRGEDLADVPLSYLVWVIEECDNVRYDLREAIKDQVAYRLNLQREVEVPTTEVVRMCDRCMAIKKMLTRWFRKWSLVLHPDRGGTHEEQSALNDAKDELVAVLTWRKTEVDF